MSKRTMDFGVKFRKCQHFKLQAFSDSYRGSSAEGRKSKTSRYYFVFGTGCLSWSSKKQEIFVESTTEVECNIATATVNQGIWINKFGLRSLIGDEGKH